MSTNYLDHPFQTEHHHRGKVPPPEAASQLYDIIEAAEAVDETHVPQQSYVPSQPAKDQALFDANASH